jgi:deoxyuridine 5'-triphosphate nucleotidohydrolase
MLDKASPLSPLGADIESVRSYFDSNGYILNYSPKYTPTCCIYSESNDILSAIGELFEIPHKISNNRITYYDTNCIDFLGKIYQDNYGIREKTKYETYIHWLMNNTKLSKLPECYVFKTDVNAIMPTKNRISDVGYDLSIIKQAKQLTNNVILYDTGIRLKVRHGLYAEIVPRSSISKSGYMLANSIAIIDNSYVGNIFIALVKIDPEAPDISLPFRCCQLIFRQQVHVDMLEVSENFGETLRGDGGFGSTGNTLEVKLDYMEKGEAGF